MYCFPLCKTKLCKILFYRFSEFLFLNASWRIYAMDVSCLARLCMTECSLEISWKCPLRRLLKKKILLASTERFKRKDVTLNQRIYIFLQYVYSSICFFVHPFLPQIEATSYFTLKLLGFKICLYRFVCVLHLRHFAAQQPSSAHSLGSSDYLAGVVSHSQTELPQTCHIQTSLPTQKN